MYSVRFFTKEGQMMSSQKIEYGNSATEPIPVIYEGYTFIGWDNDFTEVKQDMDIFPMYEQLTFTVKFVDWDDTEVNVQKVAYGKDAIEPEHPDSRRSEDYIPDGWDKDFTNVKEDVVVKAQYKIQAYVVNFYRNLNTDDKKDLILSIKVRPGKSLKSELDELPEAKAESYHTFLHYSYNDGTKCNITDPINEDTNIHARWKFNYSHKCETNGVVPPSPKFPVEDSVKMNLRPGKYHVKLTGSVWHDCPGGYVEFNASISGSPRECTLHFPYYHFFNGDWGCYEPDDLNMKTWVEGLSDAYAQTGMPNGTQNSVIGGGVWGNVSSSNRISRTLKGQGIDGKYACLYDPSGAQLAFLPFSDLSYSKIVLTCDKLDIIR